MKPFYATIGIERAIEIVEKGNRNSYERKHEMRRIAKFGKVSFSQYLKDYCDTYNLNPTDYEIVSLVKNIYDNIEIPKRATKGSAGYDFFAPKDIILAPGETTKIPTGICVQIDSGWVLKCYPRSGLGFKYRLQLNNTVGIIDSDYFFANNEGHIFAKLTNDTNEGKTLNIPISTGFMQGIFVEYGITKDDNATETRNGGLGSTTKQQ